MYYQSKEPWPSRIQKTPIIEIFKILYLFQEIEKNEELLATCTKQTDKFKFKNCGHSHYEFPPPFLYESYTDFFKRTG